MRRGRLPTKSEGGVAKFQNLINFSPKLNSAKPTRMQLTAKLIQLLPLQTGSGKNGEWRKQDIIVETGDKFPKKVCVSLWGDKIDNAKLKVGNTLRIDFDVESREYNSRWYTDVKAWKVEVEGGSREGGKFEDQTADYVPPAVDLSNQSDDDLPF
jgi:hypothetical protein